MTFQELYECAKRALRPRVLSPFAEAGGVAAALLTEGGNVYLGVCIDTACSLGMCAERNAIASMITNGEHEINKLVCVAEGGRVAMPCGACRELMMQLSPRGSAEILVSEKTWASVSLGALMPDWWGKERGEG